MVNMVGRVVVKKEYGFETEFTVHVLTSTLFSCSVRVPVPLA
jgi:hypothetical protein